MIVQCGIESYNELVSFALGVGMRFRGSTGTETMMVISVVVISSVSAAYAFVPRFGEGVDELAWKTKEILRTGSGGRTYTSADGTVTGSTFGNNRDEGVNSGHGGTDGRGYMGSSVKLSKNLEAERTIARADALPAGTQACGAFPIAAALGLMPKAVYEEMKDKGYLDPEGRATLERMQEYLKKEHDACSSVTTGATPRDLQAALARGESVVVVVDAKRDAGGNPIAAPGCGGDCGHVMRFTGMTDDGLYRFVDDSGATLLLTRDQLAEIWAPHGSEILAIPKPGEGSCGV